MTNKKEIMENNVVEVVENLNAVQLLLGIDMNKVKMPKKVHKMYCKKLGKVVPFELEALAPSKATEIQQKSLKYEMQDEKTSFEVDLYTQKLRTVTEGCKIFKNKDIMDNFDCATPHQLIETLLLNGELTELYSEINKLSEVEKVNGDDIKN